MSVVYNYVALEQVGNFRLRHINKGEFHFEPISVFVYIFAMDQSERAKRKNVNKRSEKIAPC